MLICLVLCAAAVLPTAFSERPEAQNVQPQTTRSNEMARRIAASFAAARNQGLLRLGKYEDGSSPIIIDDTLPPFSDIYISPYLFHSALQSEPENEFPRKNELLSRSLDQIGGGHLLRRETILDSIGGGHLLKRDNGIAALDPIGGGHLLKREFQLRQLDAIGGGHLLKRDLMNVMGRENLLKRYSLDSIGGGHLLKRELEPRQLDAIGGGHLLRRTVRDKAKNPNLEFYANETN